jgi:DNA-binding transcriptional LysR family regulator
MHFRMGGSMAGLDWDDLRSFLMIARHRTLSGAARALGVRQPTMGRRLAALEARAGAKLLQKTPTGYVLTEAGEAVLANVERIEAEAQAVERLVAGKDIRLAGIVRLTTVDTLAVAILTPIIAAFRLSHPLVEVEIAASTRLFSLSRREADVALRPGPFTQGDIAVRKVGIMAFGLYASKSYLARHGEPDWSNGAAGHYLITTEHDLLDTAEMVWLRSVAPEATVALASNSRFMHLAAAHEGIGLICYTRHLADGDPELVRLSGPATAPQPPKRELWLGVHNDMRHTPRIRAFTTALQEGLRRAAARLDPPDLPAQ